MLAAEQHPAAVTRGGAALASSRRNCGTDTWPSTRGRSLPLPADWQWPHT